MKTPQQKMWDWGTNPKTFKRDCQDLRHGAGDLIYNRPARTIYYREATKAIGRFSEDVADNYRSAFGRRK